MQRSCAAKRPLLTCLLHSHIVIAVEYNNGTSFIFSRDQPLCKVLHFDVGILYPNWLENATLLGSVSG